MRSIKLDSGLDTTMQQMPFGRIVAFVEGSMERIFVNKNFSYVEVVSVPNGESWSLDRLAKLIASLYRSKDINADKVVVWFDRERRDESPDVIRSAVQAELIAAGAPPDGIIMCIPDRMTENIILADEELMRSHFKDPTYSYAGDGVNGKHVLKLLHEKNGNSYKETFHGAALLKKTVLSRSATRSNSAQIFFEEFDLECWWNR